MRASGSGDSGSEHCRLVEQQLGELRRLGERALQLTVDLVEVVEDPGGLREVGERDDDGRHARCAHPARHQDGQHQPGQVRQDPKRRDERVDAQVVVVPRQQGELAVVAHPPPVLGGLPAFGGVGADGIHVGERVGDVPRQLRPRRLPQVHQCLPAPDQRRDGHAGERDDPEQHDDQQRVVLPQHHRRERQRHEVRDDLERQGVDEVLVLRRVAEHPLGQRAREVRVEEVRVLGQQRVHAADRQPLDPVRVGAVEAVDAQPPEQLPGEQGATEREQVRGDQLHGE